jgi:ABC-type Co2+ transport system permease subunit
VWLVWPLFGLLACLSIITSGFSLLSQDGSTSALRLAGDALISLVTPVVFATVAALILSRQPRNTIGWVLMVPVGAFVIGTPLENYVEHLAPSSPEPTVPLLLMVWFGNWGWLLLIFSLLHVPLLFPNGQLPTPRWRWVSVAAVAWAALFVLLVTFSRRINAGTTPELVFDNPVGVLGGGTVELLAGVWVVGLLALVVASVVALFVRYRRTNDTEREQIKWLLYACALFLVVFASGTLSRVGGSNSLGGYIWAVFFGLSLVALPAAIGTAILRYRLYDIDLLINRTLVYGSLTAALVLIYLGAVVVLQRALSFLSGEGSQLTIVASTLAIAALFNPLRGAIQGFIDRRFYRQKYDARETLEAFSGRLREGTDLDELSRDLSGVVRDTVAPEHVSLWLRPGTASKEVHVPD